MSHLLAVATGGDRKNIGLHVPPSQAPGEMYRARKYPPRALDLDRVGLGELQLTLTIKDRLAGLSTALDASHPLFQLDAGVFPFLYSTIVADVGEGVDFDLA